MINATKAKEYYNAFLAKDSSYDGSFYVGIKTTGIFCRATCSARKAHFTNCQFFLTAEDALLAGYRTCKRCQPLHLPDSPSILIKKLTEAVEQNLNKRWTDKDVKEMGMDPSTARRQFKKRFGLTFVAYARARRMGAALDTLRAGEKVIYAQIDSGYESGSGFREAFSKLIGEAPSKRYHNVLLAQHIDTPLGPMVSIADEKGVHLLEFMDRQGLKKEIEQLHKRKYAIIPGQNKILNELKAELGEYFAGRLKKFRTPVHFFGSQFQIKTLKELCKIPLGSTITYNQQAKNIGQPSAVRAVARANGRNQIAILIPCHRVIGSSGSLTGYSGGLARKEWMIKHEKRLLLKDSTGKKR